MIECVPNFSEGREIAVIDAIEDAIRGVPGTILLGRTSDRDHNRSVITFAGTEEAVLEAAVRAAASCVGLIDLNKHEGVHPRLGAMDVLPFVPLSGATMEDCIRLAHRAGQRIWEEVGIPVYFYEAAALRPERVKLENVRRGQFEVIRHLALSDPEKRPDVGGPGVHPTAGAIAVGARKVLIAYNINLRSEDLRVAKDIAKRIRSSNGGLPAVKAMGVPLSSRGLVQVSMNLTDFELTPPHVVYGEVSRLCAEHGVEIEESELIGLIPAKALELAGAAHLRLNRFDRESIIENRILERGRTR